jgi:hypothetical protein
MAVAVSFLRPVTAGGGATAAGRVRKKESIAIAGTTTITAQAGEMALILNTESTAILVAWGSTPDAQAATETSATSAGVGIPIGWNGWLLLGPLAEGDKVNAKVVA